MVLDKTVSLDLMYLDSSAVLHIVEKDTKFSAAPFLPDETTDETWNAFMRIWRYLYRVTRRKGNRSGTVAQIQSFGKAYELSRHPTQFLRCSEPLCLGVGGI